MSIIFATMNNMLINPVYNALLTRDAGLGFGTDTVRSFDEEVSPFVGFGEENQKGFEELADLLPVSRKIIYAKPSRIVEPRHWKISVQMAGLQFVYEGVGVPPRPSVMLTRLQSSHVEEMVQLAMLTKPGPFNTRTIEFGNYHGVFDDGKLVAMAGQRMHPGPYTEISAVCTHPEHLGKGYAAALITHQLESILDEGNKPFLHVRADNERAVALYLRLGFKVSREMNFYFMKRK